MGGFSGWPNYNSFITQSWGSPSFESACSWFGNSSNIVLGTNPPYTASDFLAFYPKFGGITTPVTVDTTSGSPTISDVQAANFSLYQPGQLITGPGIPAGSLITAVSASPNTITISQNATQDATDVVLQVFSAPFVPMIVINMYIALASASLVQKRWFDMWPLAVGWFVAHFCTLYLRSDGDTYSSAGRAAAAGLNVGITVSKGAGPVNQGLQLVGGLEDWGMWASTTYGIQFAQMAKVIGGGPMLIY